MKVNEIMIGDWVLNTFDKPMKVRDIITFDNKYSAKRYVNGDILGGGYAYCQREENIKPISLTAEILEKNGFSLDASYKPHLKWRSADNRITLHNEDEYLNTYNKWHIHVDTEDMRTIGSIELTYVHQFQQILRLCGMNDLADNFEIK